MLVTDKNYPGEETFFYYGYIYNSDKVTSVEEIKAINGDYCGVLCKDDCVIAVHKTNIEVYLANPAGIGEHSDVVEAVIAELNKLAEADDRLEMLDKHFK